jgi:hypothetical protein
MAASQEVLSSIELVITPWDHVSIPFPWKSMPDPFTHRVIGFDRPDIASALEKYENACEG